MLDRASSPRVVLIAGHGAGGDVDAADLVALRDRLVPTGVTVARVRQPYRVRGRRAPEHPSRLDAAFVAAVAGVRRLPGLAGVPLVVAGRSSGARVACRTAAAVDAAAVVVLAFPLRPAGRADRTGSRVGELLAVGRPALVVQGDRDPFGTSQDVRAAVDAVTAVNGGPAAGRWLTVVGVPGADHAFRARRADQRTSADCVAQVADEVAGWLAGQAWDAARDATRSAASTSLT